MERKLKVGFVEIGDASSVRTWSGTPFNILQAIRVNHNVEVTLISPLKTTFKWLYFLPKMRCTLAKEAYDWRREEGSLRSFARQIESVFRSRKLDVVFSTSSVPVTRLDASIPSVFWTDAVFQSYDGYYPGKWSKRTRRIAGKQEEAALHRSSFACYSSHWAASAAQALTEPDHVKVLPFGPNLPIEHGRAEVLDWIQERRNAQKLRCNLLYVGLDWVRKGGPVAVEAARVLNDLGISTKLTVVGHPPREPLPSFVEVVGFVDKNQPEGYRRLVNLYRTSDIFILPSRAECSAVVLAEAAAFGLPVLTCDTGGLPDYVTNGKNGFRIPVEDGGALFAEKAKSILSEYDQFAINAYTEFEERLNWDVSVRHLVELLKRAADLDAT